VLEQIYVSGETRVVRADGILYAQERFKLARNIILRHITTPLRLARLSGNVHHA
jgi:(2Fe-2S) ferredoxin